MVKLLGIIFILALGSTSLAYAQVADNTIGGVIVPNTVSTQSNYCFNGTCHTAPIPQSVNYTHSTDKLPVLLISLSQTCEILIKHGMAGCPSIESLVQYDTSNQQVSGKFIKVNGVMVREKPEMKQNWLAYTYSNHGIICVECVFDFTATAKSKEIIIQPNSFTYINKTESESKNTWSSFANRYMQGCDTATISNIPGLLNDTIHFMLNNCIKTSTSFNIMTNHTRTIHPFSFNNPYSTLHQDSYLKSLLQGHTYDFGNMTAGGRGPPDCLRHECNFIDPYKKVGW